MDDLYYMQDSRQMVGNDMMWWAKCGKGYTTDLSRAEVWTKRRALEQHENRDTDMPWPKGYIDGKAHPAVDFHVVGEVAMQGL